MHLCNYTSGKGEKRKLCLQSHRKCEAHAYGKSNDKNEAGTAGSSTQAGASGTTAAAAGTSTTAEPAPTTAQARLNALTGRRN